MGALKMQDRKMEDWILKDHFARAMALSTVKLCRSRIRTISPSGSSPTCNSRLQDQQTALTNGLPIRRPRKKSQLLNETRLLSCMSKFDDCRYSRLQFLRAAGHSVSKPRRGLPGGRQQLNKHRRR